jgi:hypothetical protein
VDYAVEPMTAVTRSVEPDTYGICDTNTKTIYVNADQPTSVQASTLVHELMHALFDVFTLPKEGLSEEDVCSKLEVPLVVLLRDNPKLVTIIRGALCQDKPLFEETT